jgi:hypothetical protein
LKPFLQHQAFESQIRRVGFAAFGALFSVIELEIVKNIYRRIRYEKRNLQIRVRKFFGQLNVPNPDKIYWLDPNRIIYHTNYDKNKKSDFKNRVFDMDRDKGYVYGGNWDIEAHKFDDLEVFRAFQDRILDAKEWEETTYYKNTLSQILSGEKRWNCRNKEQWDARCAALDYLIKSIRENGYFANHQLKLNQGNYGLFYKSQMAEEITVNIGRNGHYFFQDGRHRLSIAKILGIKKIPVKVLVRHKDWQELREKMLLLSNINTGTNNFNMLYQPCIHPDLEGVTLANQFEEYYQILKQNITVNKGSVLELGANLSFFCHKFEDLGFDCHAIEQDPEIAYIANKIRIAENKTFKIYCGSLIDSETLNQTRKNRFEIVIALSTLHRFLKTETSFNHLVKFLNNLTSNTMYFQPNLYNNREMLRAYIKFKNNNDFIDFILKNTNFNKFKLIHKPSDGRHIYKLYKSGYPQS